MESKGISLELPESKETQTNGVVASITLIILSETHETQYSRNDINGLNQLWISTLITSKSFGWTWIKEFLAENL